MGLPVRLADRGTLVRRESRAHRERPAGPVILVHLASPVLQAGPELQAGLE